MEIAMTIYAALACLIGFLGIAHANDGHGINWRMILALLMLIVSPLVAKFCGLV